MWFPLLSLLPGFAWLLELREPGVVDPLLPRFLLTPSPPSPGLLPKV